LFHGGSFSKGQVDGVPYTKPRMQTSKDSENLEHLWGRTKRVLRKEITNKLIIKGQKIRLGWATAGNLNIWGRKGCRGRTVAENLRRWKCGLKRKIPTPWERRIKRGERERVKKRRPRQIKRLLALPFHNRQTGGVRGGKKRGGTKISQKI